MLVQHLRRQPQAGLLESVFALAGETRSPDELLELSGWSSYTQVRNLLEAFGSVLPPGALANVAVDSVSNQEKTATAAATTTMLQDSGSLATMFAEVGVIVGMLSSIVIAAGEEVGDNEWLIRYRFKPGFAPYPQSCEFEAGMLAAAAMMFGFPPAAVVHESCECRGDDACVFRVRWDAIDEQLRRADFFEQRDRASTRQLDALRGTITDLVVTEDLDEVLSRIIRSATNAVLAPSFVLALTANRSVTRRVYSAGLDESDANIIARELLERDGVDDRERAVVEIASARCRYGILAAIRPDSLGFLPQELIVLQAYAGVAAAALDSATAVDDARRQANTARALLALSRALTDASSTTEIASTIAAAAAQITGCGQVLLALRDPASTALRFEAVGGCSPSIVEDLNAHVAAWASCDDEGGAAIEALLQKHGAQVVGSSPITSNGVATGWLVVGSDDEFALSDQDSQDRINGLAAQASMAFSNARRLDQIRHQALYDGLTALPNRTLILDRVDQMLARARRHESPAAVLFLDIDGFKTVNDTIGHDVGDRLLKAVATRLAATVRDADTVGRLGGDEFVVLVEGRSLDAGPELVAQRLLDVLREPFILDDPAATRLCVSASIGIAAGDRPSHIELLRDADVALYAAKARGKGCFVVFQPEMYTAVKDRAELESDLAGALAADQFFAVYQPIIDLRTMEISGVEALLRWRHPCRGVIAPNDFIPALEDTGLIIDVGAWIVTLACQQTAAWHREGHRIDISVNVSGRQLEQPQFVDVVRGALGASGLDPSSLILEVTESVIMRDPDAVVQRLEHLKALGIRIAIDDFGTGYSSLAYLQKFPVDCLKIDQSFIAAIAESREAEALVHTLVQLGKTLGLQTLAEGIEAATQINYLQDQNCDSGQGFLFAKPLSVEDIHDLLDAQHAISKPV